MKVKHEHEHTVEDNIVEARIEDHDGARFLSKRRMDYQLGATYMHHDVPS